MRWPYHDQSPMRLPQRPPTPKPNVFDRWEPNDFYSDANGDQHRDANTKQDGFCWIHRSEIGKSKPGQTIVFLAAEMMAMTTGSSISVSVAVRRAPSLPVSRRWPVAFLIDHKNTNNTFARKLQKLREFIIGHSSIRFNRHHSLWFLHKKIHIYSRRKPKDHFPTTMTVSGRECYS